MMSHSEYRALKPVESHSFSGDGRRRAPVAEIRLGLVGGRWLVSVVGQLAGRTFGAASLGYWVGAGPQASWPTRAEALTAAVERLVKYCSAGSGDAAASRVREWASALLAQSGDLFAHAV